MSGEPVVVARGLSKRMGGLEAVRDVTFDVARGSVYGLVGRNGSGKTTTLRLLLGLLRPDAGSSSVLGADSMDLPADVRRRIGYLSEEEFPYDDLPVPETLQWLSAFFPAWDWDRAERWVRRFDVPREQKLSEMSKGERRRAELILVLAQGPDLLVLDDPALGLDATVRRDFLAASLEIVRDEGATVLFTSHVLTDVERVVDTVAFLDRGAVRSAGALDEVKARTKRLVLPGAAARADGVVVPGEVRRRVEGGDLVVVTEAFGAPLEARLRVAHSGVVIEDLNLEELFVEVLGRADGDSA